MQKIERLVRRLDAFQQRSRPFGFMFAVVKKFGDDRGGTLAALLTYYGFLALFPLLLLLVTILGLALSGNPPLQRDVLRSALSDFPVIGDQLRANIHSLRLNGFALAVGLVGLLWGSLGVTQAAQYAMAQIWNVEGKFRPPFWPRLARGLLFIALLAFDLAATAALAELAAFGGGALWTALASLALGAVLNVIVFIGALRVLTPKSIETRHLVPGAFMGGIAFTALQVGGSYLVTHQLRHASQVYGLFAIVLGLLSWLYLSAQVALYAAEINVVRARRLWPRSIVQPPFTGPDRRVLHDIVEQEIRRPEQRVEVGFVEDGPVHDDGGTRP